MICDHGISGARLASWWRRVEGLDLAAPPLGVCACCTGPVPVVLEVAERIVLPAGAAFWLGSEQVAGGWRSRGHRTLTEPLPQQPHIGLVGVDGCGFCKFCQPQAGAQLALGAE